MHAPLALALSKLPPLIRRQLLESQHTLLVLLYKLRLVDLHDNRCLLLLALEPLAPLLLDESLAELDLEDARQQIVALLVQQADVAHVHAHIDRVVLIVLVESSERPVLARECGLHPRRRRT